MSKISTKCQEAIEKSPRFVEMIYQKSHIQIKSFIIQISGSESLSYISNNRLERQIDDRLSASFTQKDIYTKIL